MTNTHFISAVELQTAINSHAKEARAMMGEKNTFEFMQYSLFITGNISENIKLRTKKAKAVKELLTEAGRSDRNAQTIISVVFNAKIGKLVKDCKTPQDVVDVLAANELDSVSKLKRFIAEPVDRVAKLLEAIGKLEQDERESFDVGYAELSAE
jgi:ribosomal protein L4